MSNRESREGQSVPSVTLAEDAGRQATAGPHPGAVRRSARDLVCATRCVYSNLQYGACTGVRCAPERAQVSGYRRCHMPLSQ